MQPVAAPGPPVRPGRAEVPGWFATAGLVVAGLWLAATTVIAQFGLWFAQQIFIVEELPFPLPIWPAATILAALLAGLPALLVILLLAGHPRLAAVARCWVVAAGCAAVLGVVRLVPEPYQATYLLVLAALAIVLTVLVRDRVSPPPGGPSGMRGGMAGDRSAVRGLVGVATGLAILLPWVWLGAFGSISDAVTAAMAAVAIGWLAATVLSRVLWPSLTEQLPRGRRLLLGGLAAAPALAVLAGSSGQPGVQLALLATLPAAGLPVAALACRDGGSKVFAPAVVAASAALGPLSFFDPEEITLVLTPRDIPYWAMVATVYSVLVAVAIFMLFSLFGRGGTGAQVQRDDAGNEIRSRDGEETQARSRGDRRRLAVAIVASGALGATALVGYAIAQPGFHGDRLFVVLNGQADLRDITGDVRQRRAEVYRRLVNEAELTQRPLRKRLDSLGIDYTPYYLVNAVEVPDEPALRAWLATRDDVARVLHNPELRPLPKNPPAARGPDRTAPKQPGWNLDAIRAPLVWATGINGRGVVVGASDSGVDGSHPALKTGFRGGDDSWYDPWYHTRTPTDRSGSGHGTHTTAIAVGRYDVGVAPGAQWIGCVNLARNFGNPARYLDCLQFMLAPFARGGDPFHDGDPARAADVLNNSWGCAAVEGCRADTLLPATRALTAAGIFVVSAAGNTGPRCGSVQDPLAPYADTFTVGASDGRRTVPGFSSRGPVTVDRSDRAKPDVVAPGVDVVSALPGDTYGPLTGTSMSSPHVAGVVALMWQANPRLVGDIQGTATILRDTARPLGPPPGSRTSDQSCGGRRNISGAGEVDALAAVRAAEAKG